MIIFHFICLQACETLKPHSNLIHDSLPMFIFTIGGKLNSYNLYEKIATIVWKVMYLLLRPLKLLLARPYWWIILIEKTSLLRTGYCVVRVVRATENIWEKLKMRMKTPIYKKSLNIQLSCTLVFDFNQTSINVSL